jgi:adenylosuccinate lyase
MSEQKGYLSPFSQRYAGRDMQFLFSDYNKFTSWRKLWVILAESERELGLPIFREQVEELKAHVADIDFDLAAAYEKKLRHDVMAHVRAYGDACPLARPIIHLGATSCYVGDNTDIIILRDALLLLRGRLADVARALYTFADTYRSLPLLAFTHFQPAQPTTAGKRATIWLRDILDDLAELEFVLGGLRPLGCKGTTGTQASFLELFDGDYAKVRRLDAMIAEKMGFDSALAVSGQTYSRKTDSRVLNLLSQIAQSAHKFSNDLRLMAHMKEMEEPFEKDQVGSSAMAYKRNPMRCERMAGLARFIIANAQNAAQTAAEQWLERTLDDSANRRIAIAEGFLACDGILALYLNIARGLEVYPKMMERHLREELPFMATENILMQAVKKGGDRQELHERIRGHSMDAGRAVKQDGEPGRLLERIAADNHFNLDLEQLKSVLNPAAYTGCAAMQTEEYLRGDAARALEKYRDAHGPEDEIKV